MGRVDGIHFPTGQDLTTRMMDVLDPTSTSVMNEPEARWHYARARALYPDTVWIWRASPDMKPAQAHWDANRYGQEIMKSLDFHADRNNGQYPLDILLLNELNLDYERGDARGDGGAWDTNPDNWPGLYRGLASFLWDLLQECRQRMKTRGLTGRFWFPAWAPGHGEQNPDLVRLWKPVAEQFNGVCLHSYGDAETITRDVQWYAEMFPDKPLLLGEWNTDNYDGDRIAEETRIRSRLRALERVYPQLGACYFIWAWAQDAARKSYDIEGNPEREALWARDADIPTDTWGQVEEPTVPDVVESRPRGIDIASYQGFPEWKKVRADDIRFAFIKASEGVSYVNPTFAAGWSGAKDADVLRASYHFARPDLYTPENEADHYWNVVRSQGVQPGDVFALDLEDYEGSLSRCAIPIRDWTYRFLTYFKVLSGTRALLYTNVGVIREHNLAAQPRIADFGLWLASWGSQMPEAPAPWGLIAVWQYSEAGKVNGIDGDVDLDYYNGDISTFTRYGYGQAEPAVTPPAPTPTTPTDLEPTDTGSGLATVVGYLTHDVADALDREVTTLEASLGALKAAIAELRRNG